jgi:hypothetical protein
MKTATVIAVALLALSACNEDGGPAASRACAALAEANALTREAIISNDDNDPRWTDGRERLNEATDIIEDNDLSESDLRAECAAEMDKLDELSSFVGD